MAFKKQTTIAIFVLLLAATPFFVRAAGLVPCGGPTEKPCTVLDAFYGVARVTNWLIAMAGIYAVYQIINHSFWLVVSNGNEEDITKHRGALTTVFIGLFVVMGAYMFVNTAVNGLLMSKCKIDFSSAWTYITLTNPGSASCLTLKPGDKGYNDFNAESGITKPSQ